VFPCTFFVLPRTHTETGVEKFSAGFGGEEWEERDTPLSAACLVLDSDGDRRRPRHCLKTCMRPCC
jgi:hypothetical protein